MPLQLRRALLCADWCEGVERDCIQLQVFLKSIADDGVLHNVRLEAVGKCVTPKAEDSKGLGQELDLMMTSGVR